MSEKIMPVTMSDTLTRENDILKNFWEAVNKSGNKTEKNVESEVIRVIKKSKEWICLRTEKIISSKIIEELRDAHNRGVRVYGLISESDKDEYLDSGIFHFSNRPIYSSYILSDPTGKMPVGLWIPSKFFNLRVGTYVNLKPQAVQEIWGHFSQEFWESPSEIFFGKKIQKIDIKHKPPMLPETLKLTSRDFKFSEFMDSNVEMVALPEKAMELGEKFLHGKDWIMASKTVMVPVDNISKEFLEDAIYEDFDIVGGDLGFGFIKLNEEVYGNQRLQALLENFGFIKLNEEGHSEYLFIFMPDMVLKLPHAMKEEIENLIESSIMWKFTREKPLKEIKNKIILWDSEWSPEYEVVVKEQEEISLSPVNCENIDKWLDYKNIPRPKLPPTLPLALKVILKWSVHPPYLPQGAKKHILYDQWEKFHKGLQDAIENMIKEMETELQRRKKKQGKKLFGKAEIKAFEAKIQEFIDDLSELNKNSSWYGHKVETEKLIEKIKSIRDEFHEVLNRYAVKEDEKEDTEIDAVTPAKNKKIKKDKTINLPTQIPRSLPNIGELYKYKTRDFLVIEFRDEIDPARKEAENYNAKIVVKKEGK